MATVTFGAAQPRINALVEMYAQAKKKGDESRAERMFEQIVNLLYGAQDPFSPGPADHYASQFSSLSAYERDKIRDQVLKRLVKMVCWFKSDYGVPFSAFVATEFINHPNTPHKRVFERESRTTDLIRIDPESGEEYILKEVSESISSLTPLQSAQIAECYGTLKNCLGEDESTDDSLLEKWGVVYPVDGRDIQPLPMRFRASVLCLDWRVASPTRPKTLSGEREVFMRDPYFKRRMWI